MENNFAQKIIFSDEAHFHLGGYVNKQNCRIWGTENSHVIIEKPMHPPRVIFQCALWSGGIIDPFCFENPAGNAISVNGERYRGMLAKSLWPEIEELDSEDLQFQQDSVTCHKAHETIDLLRTKFGNSLLSRFCNVNQPAWSSDLTPLEFFLWGTVKYRCYADNPETIKALKLNIG